MQRTGRVFIVDDDRAVVRALERLLTSYGYAVETFDSPQQFLECPPYDGTACLLLDLRMPGLNGLEVQEAMAINGHWMPIVFLSGEADVPSTAKAMRYGAVDFLVKPVDEVQLIDALSRALTRDEELRRRRIDMRDASDRLARLTRREREVCERVALGLLNKQIAFELGTSEKTVKVHRGRVMQKLGVESVAALVRLLSQVEKPLQAR